MSAEPIDVVDIGTDAETPSAYPRSTGFDQLPGPPPAGAVLGRWRWWARADSLSRALAVLSATAAAIALTILADAVRSSPGPKPQIRVIHVGPGIAGALPGIAGALPGIAGARATVDATGCPVQRRCLVVPAAVTSVTAVRRALPGGRVLTAVETVDRGGHIYARRVAIRQQSVTLRLLAQCVPGARIVAPPSTESVTREIDTAMLANGEAKLLRDRRVTRRAVTEVGPVDCTVSVLYTDIDTDSVTARQHRGIREAALRDLATDRRVALTDV